MFEFWIECNEQYVVNKTREDDYHGLARRATTEIRVLRRYLENLDRMTITEAPTNQFYKVSWACNDELNVYDK